jgi:hypothetical protein
VYEAKSLGNLKRECNYHDLIFVKILGSLIRRYLGDWESLKDLGLLRNYFLLAITICY